MKPLQLGHWNFRLRISNELDWSRHLDIGWRTLDLGIFCLKADVPDGEDLWYCVDRGFWWRIDFWLPWRWRKR